MLLSTIRKMTQEIPEVALHIQTVMQILISIVKK